MGQKRDPNQPRKPMKRSYIKRKAPFKPSQGSLKAQTGVQTGQDKAYALFMAQWRGEPSVLSGRMASKFLTDEKGRKLKTEAHHILPRSVYPEYKMEDWNVAVLTREEHSWVEDNPTLFMRWLEMNEPEWFAAIQEHKHHRKRES